MSPGFVRRMLPFILAGMFVTLAVQHRERATLWMVLALTTTFLGVMYQRGR